MRHHLATTAAATFVGALAAAGLRAHLQARQRRRWGSSGVA
jgi:hypothetical protein